MSASFSLDFMISSASQQIQQCKEWIKDAACVFVNQQEYEILKELYPLQQIRMLVVTDGNGPIRVHGSGVEIFGVPAPTHVVYEVTSAGDTLAGTFLVYYILQKDPLDVAMKKAIAAAQESLQGPGAWRKC